MGRIKLRSVFVPFGGASAFFTVIPKFSNWTDHHSSEKYMAAPNQPL
jgi:hypothetical protein